MGRRATQIRGDHCDNRDSLFRALSSRPFIRPSVIMGHARIQVPSREHSLMTDTKSQLEKFKEGARDLETDDDPDRFKEKLAKLVKHKPVEKPE